MELLSEFKHSHEGSHWHASAKLTIKGMPPQHVCGSAASHEAACALLLERAAVMVREYISIEGH